MNPTTARLNIGAAETDHPAPTRPQTRRDTLASVHDIAAVTKIRRKVATIHASEARIGTPSALFAAISRAIAALDVTGIDAVVLRGRRLFETDGRIGLRNDPDVQAAVRAVTRCAAPVVAMIEGSAAGPGLELALACAARAARDGASFAFPGVGFGRLPIHGAARHLPRLIGYPDAARMLVFGETVSAREALRLGLIDVLDIDDVERFAAVRRSGGEGMVRRHPTASEKTAAEVVLLGIGQRLKRERPGEATPLAALRVMEAAIGVAEAEAMAEAARLDEKLSHSEEAGALFHATAGAHALGAIGAEGESRLADLSARAFWPLLREAIHLLDEGASPAQVDRCLTAYGFAAGPFAQSDARGAANLFKSGASAEAPHWHSYSPTFDLMVDAGRPGGPGQAGWYRLCVGDGAAPRSDPAVDRVLENSAVSQRMRRRPIADEVIARRCLYAAMNGTAALAGAAPDLDARALDAIWTTRLGFPRWKGGPLFQGVLVGRAAVVAELEVSRRTRDTAGAPSPLLGRLLADTA